MGVHGAAHETPTPRDPSDFVNVFEGTPWSRATPTSIQSNFLRRSVSCTSVLTTVETGESPDGQFWGRETHERRVPDLGPRVHVLQTGDPRRVTKEKP